MNHEINSAALYLERDSGFFLKTLIASRREPGDHILSLSVRTPFQRGHTMQGGCFQSEQFTVDDCV
jgi:hypothetical protein